MMAPTTNPRPVPDTQLAYAETSSPSRKRGCSFFFNAIATEKVSSVSQKARSRVAADLRLFTRCDSEALMMKCLKFMRKVAVTISAAAE